MKFGWFRRDPHAATIRGLYGAIVAQARAPTFYAEYGVPDTVSGRFDLIVLHLALLTRRLRVEPALTRAFGQKVFDLFCADMDHNLREMGIGDLSVPKHMRRVAEAFYGRATAYDAALATADDAALAAALARNVFADAAGPPIGAWRLASYVRAAIDHLAGQAGTAFAQGRLAFPDPCVGDVPLGRREKATP